jgi:hypothetical protein
MVTPKSNFPDILPGQVENPMPHEEPLVVRSRESHIGSLRTVHFQWYDGAGDLIYWMLSPEESVPYLKEA